MAARLRRDHDEQTRSRIKATQLVKRLFANALAELPKEMTPGQVRSAEILLRKVLPDLQAMTVKGDEDSPLRTVNKVEIEIVRPSS